MQDNLNFNSPGAFDHRFGSEWRTFWRRSSHLVCPRCQGETNQLLHISLWDTCCNFWIGDSFAVCSTSGWTFGSDREAYIAAACCTSRSWSSFSSSRCDDWLQGLLLPHNWWQCSTSRSFWTSLHLGSPWSQTLWTSTLGDTCTNSVDGGRCADKAHAEQAAFASTFDWLRGVPQREWTSFGARNCLLQLTSTKMTWRLATRSGLETWWQWMRSNTCKGFLPHGRELCRALHPGLQVQASGWWPRFALCRWAVDKRKEKHVMEEALKRSRNSSFRRRWSVISIISAVCMVLCLAVWYLWKCPRRMQTAMETYRSQMIQLLLTANLVERMLQAENNIGEVQIQFSETFGDIDTIYRTLDAELDHILSNAQVPDRGSLTLDQHSPNQMPRLRRPSQSINLKWNEHSMRQHRDLETTVLTVRTGVVKEKKKRRRMMVSW